MLINMPQIPSQHAAKTAEPYESRRKEPRNSLLTVVLLSLSLAGCNPAVPESFAGKWHLEEPYVSGGIYWIVSPNSLEWGSPTGLKGTPVAEFGVVETTPDRCILELKSGTEVLISDMPGAILHHVEPGGRWVLRREKDQLIAERQFKWENDKKSNPVQIEFYKSLYDGGVCRLRFRR